MPARGDPGAQCLNRLFQIRIGYLDTCECPNSSEKTLSCSVELNMGYFVSLSTISGEPGPIRQQEWGPAGRLSQPLWQV